MRSVFNLVCPPGVDSISGVRQGSEPRGVKVLLSDARIECFDVGNIREPSGPGEVQPDGVQVGSVGGLTTAPEGKLETTHCMSSRGQIQFPYVACTA